MAAMEPLVDFGIWVMNSRLMVKKPESLTPEEEKHSLRAAKAIETMSACVEANVPLVIDAEHSTVQPAIDYLTYSSAIKYNKDDKPIVYGTIQAT
ncbi:hypothetical protein GH714_032122 [Hevea brasiliensis]|uniref:Proline dehydrogenase n=1 Tax=Hevea brasiliensis TaxID=3981 RepID=A0A6A6LDJ4_HEVBR|nr:hypothetical protein GH714_032122 [Hevea brasiliensis]